MKKVKSSRRFHYHGEIKFGPVRQKGTKITQRVTMWLDPTELRLWLKP